MDLHLAGKAAVVTGASKGIGLAVTRALAEEGVNVVAGKITYEAVAQAHGLEYTPLAAALAAAAA